jgi:hypothetical protein
MNWPKASKASITDPSRAAPLCKSFLAGDPIIGNIRFTSQSEGRRSFSIGSQTSTSVPSPPQSNPAFDSSRVSDPDIWTKCREGL